VERDGEQCGSLRVNEITAPKITGIVSPPDHDLRGTRGKALSNDVGSIDAALRSKSGEKDGVLARQHLWPSMRNLSLAQCRNGLRLATGSWHAQQLRPRRRVWVEDDEIIIAPRGAARIKGVDVADGDGGAPSDPNL